MTGRVGGLRIALPGPVIQSGITGTDLHRQPPWNGSQHGDSDGADRKEVLEEVFDVTAGDCFTVKPGQVHQLENSGPGPLNALFGCSATHLTTARTVLGAFR
jgi:hypothetical protein